MGSVFWFSVDTIPVDYFTWTLTGASFVDPSLSRELEHVGIIIYRGTVVAGGRVARSICDVVPVLNT